MARWKDVKTVATIGPDYAYGRDLIGAFVANIKKLRPDIKIVDQQWPKLGEPDFTSFITAQMGKNPDAVDCVEFAGDFVTFCQGGGGARLFQDDPKPLGGQRRSRQYRGGRRRSATTIPTGSPPIQRIQWSGAAPTSRRSMPNTSPRVAAVHPQKYPPSFAIQGYISINALADGIRKAGNTNSDAVSKALTGMTFDTPFGKRPSASNRRDVLSRILGRHGQECGLSVGGDEGSGTAAEIVHADQLSMALAHRPLPASWAKARAAGGGCATCVPWADEHPGRSHPAGPPPLDAGIDANDNRAAQYKFE